MGKKVEEPRVKRPYNRKVTTEGAAVQSPPSARSLLQLVGDAPSPPLAPPGFFMDFTGQEDLLAWVSTLSDDPCQDILGLLQHLRDGNLCRRQA